MVAKRPASTKSQEWNSVKYVRGKRAVPGSGLRKHQTRWKRTLVEILSCSDFQIVKLLIPDQGQNTSEFERQALPEVQ